MLRSAVLILMTCLLSASCMDRAPERDQVNVIRGRLNRLQSALKDRNRAVLDSLASPDMIDAGMSIDSLLSFVSGPEHYAFDHFGKCEFIYNSKKARIDCALVDSALHPYDSVTITFVRAKDTWWLKRIEPALQPIDSQ